MVALGIEDLYCMNRYPSVLNYSVISINRDKEIIDALHNLNSVQKRSVFLDNSHEISLP
jgi:hypothetical protein